MDFKIASWNIRGLGKLTKQNEIKNLIRNENLSVCAILETHMKKDRISKVCDRIFGNWEWQHNLNMSIKGCRIIVGWNSEVTSCTLIHSEILSSDIKFFCTFIYAANHGRDRRELWKDLRLFKQIINDEAWVLMGDVNVSLNLEDHSEGTPYVTQDMMEFQDCVNAIEVEDLCSTGFQYTWTKSLLNPNATVLKKLDRIMINNKFLTNHVNANARFLPYGISDHSPAIMSCPDLVMKMEIVKDY